MSPLEKPKPRPRWRRFLLYLLGISSLAWPYLKRLFDLIDFADTTRAGLEWLPAVAKHLADSWHVYLGLALIAAGSWQELSALWRWFPRRSDGSGSESAGIPQAISDEAAEGQPKAIAPSAVDDFHSRWENVVDRYNLLGQGYFLAAEILHFIEQNGPQIDGDYDVSRQVFRIFRSRYSNAIEQYKEQWAYENADKNAVGSIWEELAEASQGLNSEQDLQRLARAIRESAKRFDPLRLTQ